MTDKRYDIKITDQIDPAISKKLGDISTRSLEAYQNLEKLNNAVKSAGGGGAVSTSVEKITRDMLAQEQATKKVDESYQKYSQTLGTVSADVYTMSNSISKLSAEQLKERISQNQSESAKIRYSAAVKRAQISTLSFNASENQLAITALKTSINQDRARLSTLAFDTAQSRAAATTLRHKSAHDGLFGSVSRSNAGMTAMVRTMIAYAGIGFGGREVIHLADSYTLLQNKIRVVVDTEQQLVETTQRVFEIANRTYTPVNETAQAFQRFDRAMSQLGATQTESLRLTETVNKALVVSGAAVSEQSAALLQLSQAFNKGKLDGDEFRTVMELMPDVSDAIAKRLNVTRGELLKLAPEGVITGQIMREALASAAADIDARFKKLTPTMAQAGTTVKNAFIDKIGEFDKFVGVSESISGALIFLSKNVEDVTRAVAIFASPLIIGAAINGVRTLAAAAIASPYLAMATAFSAATAAVVLFKDEISLASDDIVVLSDQVTGLGRAFEYLFSSQGHFLNKLPGFLDVIESETIDVAMQRIRDAETKYIKTVSKESIRSVAEGAEKTMLAAFNKGEAEAVKKRKKSGGSPVEDYSVFVDRNVSAIESEIDALGSLGDEYTAVQKIQQINIQLAQRKQKLTQDDEDLLYGMITLLEQEKALQKELSKIYAESVGLQLSLAIEQNAITEAKERGFITDYKQKQLQDELNDKVIKSIADNEKFNQLYDERVVKARELNAAEIGIKMAYDAGIITLARYNEELGKLLLEKREHAGINKEVSSTQKEVSSLYQETIGKSMGLHSSMLDLVEAFNAGAINMNTFKHRLLDIRVELAELRLEMNDATFADGLIVAFDKVRGGFENLATSTSKNMGIMLDSLSDGFADSIGRAIVMGDDLGDSLKNVAKNAMAELISATVRMGIQWAVSSAMQKSAMASMSATSTAAAAQQTTAWAPAATTASIATIGGAAAIGIAAVIAAIAASKAFKTGGYTGDYGTDDIAGVVHGREYVMDAQTVQRVGVRNLEALQRGTANIQRPDNIINNTTNNTVNNGGGRGETRVIVVNDPAMAKNYFNSPEGRDFVVQVMADERDRVREVLL